MHKGIGLKALLFCLVFCKFVFAWGMDVSISQIGPSVCKMRVYKQKVSFEAESIRVTIPNSKTLAINNKCSFAMVSKKKRYLEVTNVNISSVFGCKNIGDSCNIILHYPKASTLQAKSSTVKSPVVVLKNSPAKPQPEKILQPNFLPKKDRLTIVIDPGHGGKDPGAIGRRGTKEKDITLKYSIFIASELKKAGHKVLLTRVNDTYIELHKRVEYAINQSADLFISIHADSAPNTNARGATVYMLSPSAINRVSERHQAKGNFVHAYDDDLNFNILNLLQSSSVKQSHAFSITLVSKMKDQDINLTMAPLRSAEFAVLKAPAFPAILLELGYLSNLEDENMLHSHKYIAKVSASIKNAIGESFTNAGSKK